MRCCCCMFKILVGGGMLFICLLELASQYHNGDRTLKIIVQKGSRS